MAMVIYALSDPRNKTIPKYVGRTVSGLRQRLAAHKTVSKRHPAFPVSKWINELKSLGLIPVIYALEIIVGENGKERETHWIRFFKPLGLLNRSDGDGCLGRPMKDSEYEVLVKNNFPITQPKLREANKRRQKRVVGEDGREFNSVSEAYKTLGVSEWGFRDCIKHHWRVKGTYWKIL